MHKITEQIWIGNSHDAGHPGPEIDGILNCAHDLANRHQWGSHHLSQCGLMDGPGNPLSAYYSAVLALHTLLVHGKRVLVHCHMGESRSVAVVICYLNALDAKGWDFWRDTIRAIRPTPEHTPHAAHREAFEQMDWDFLKRAVAPSSLGS